MRLNHESEFVTGISGEMRDGCIFSLTFHTNERKHEVICPELKSDRRTRERFEFLAVIHDRREFGDFFGSCDYCSVNSISLYLKPILSGAPTVKQEEGAWSVLFCQFNFRTLVFLFLFIIWIRTTMIYVMLMKFKLFIYIFLYFSIFEILALIVLVRVSFKELKYNSFKIVFIILP